MKKSPYLILPALLLTALVALGTPALVSVTATRNQIKAWCIDNGYPEAVYAWDAKGRLWWDAEATGHAAPRADMLSSPTLATRTMQDFRAALTNRVFGLTNQVTTPN